MYVLKTFKPILYLIMSIAHFVCTRTSAQNLHLPRSVTYTCHRQDKESTYHVGQSAELKVDEQ